MAVAEILTIGNEILDGRVVDTNRVYIGRKLSELGVDLRYSQSVDDHLGRVVAALELASSRSDIIICTGGLGPTTDDLTAEAAAKFLNCPWELSPKAEEFLKKLFSERNRDLNPAQLKQAKLPRLCDLIHNPVGTAPGFMFKGAIKSKKIALYFLPGVPREMHSMFEATVLKDFESGTFKKYTWSTLFTSEGDLQQKISSLESDIAPLRIAFRAHFPENHISLVGDLDSEELINKWQQKKEDLSKLLSPLSYHEGIEMNYEEILVERLQSKGAQLLGVESCTGGLVSHLLSDVSGVSSVLWGSQVCYSNEEKIKLGVPPDIILQQGAVSSECSEAMAKAGLMHLKKINPSSPFSYRVIVTTTGIAGPTGGSEAKPVGLLYTSVLIEDIQSGTIKIVTDKVVAPKFFDRKAMKLYFAKKALENLRLNFLRS